MESPTTAGDEGASAGNDQQDGSDDEGPVSEGGAGRDAGPRQAEDAVCETEQASVPPEENDGTETEPTGEHHRRERDRADACLADPDWADERFQQEEQATHTDEEADGHGASLDVDGIDEAETRLAVRIVGGSHRGSASRGGRIPQTQVIPAVRRHTIEPLAEGRTTRFCPSARNGGR